MAFVRQFRAQHTFLSPIEHEHSIYVAHGTLTGFAYICARTMTFKALFFSPHFETHLCYRLLPSFVRTDWSFLHRHIQMLIDLKRIWSIVFSEEGVSIGWCRENDRFLPERRWHLAAWFFRAMPPKSRRLSANSCTMFRWRMIETLCYLPQRAQWIEMWINQNSAKVCACVYFSASANLLMHERNFTWWICGLTCSCHLYTTHWAARLSMNMVNRHDKCASQTARCMIFGPKMWRSMARKLLNWIVNITLIFLSVIERSQH